MSKSYTLRIAVTGAALLLCVAVVGFRALKTPTLENDGVEGRNSSVVKNTEFGFMFAPMIVQVLDESVAIQKTFSRCNIGIQFLIRSITFNPSGERAALLIGQHWFHRVLDVFGIPVLRSPMKVFQAIDYDEMPGYFLYEHRRFSSVFETPRKTMPHVVGMVFVGANGVGPQDKYERAVGISDGIRLLPQNPQSNEGGNNASAADSHQRPSSPNNIPPWRFLWPLFRLIGGFIFMVSGGVLIVKYVDRFMGLGIGVLLFISGWLLLLAPVSWWW
jgi:hypothetical protein